MDLGSPLLSLAQLVNILSSTENKDILHMSRYLHVTEFGQRSLGNLY